MQPTNNTTQPLSAEEGPLCSYCGQTIHRDLPVSMSGLCVFHRYRSDCLIAHRNRIQQLEADIAEAEMRGRKALAKEANIRLHPNGRPKSRSIDDAKIIADLVAGNDALTKDLAKARKEADRFKDRVDRLEEPFVDERGVSWLAPTAWAYRQVCVARDKHAALAAQRGEVLKEEYGCRCVYGFPDYYKIPAAQVLFKCKRCIALESTDPEKWLSERIEKARAEGAAEELEQQAENYSFQSPFELSDNQHPQLAERYFMPVEHMRGRATAIRKEHGL